MIRSIFINFSARLAMQVMYFCTLLLTTHLLGSEVRGEISLIQLAINMVHLVSDIVGGPALVYLVPRTKLRTLMISGWLWATASTAGIGLLFIYFDIIPAEHAVGLLVASFLLSLNSINMNILLGQERIREYNFLLYMQGILMLGTMAISVLVFNHMRATPYLEACYVAYGGCFLAGLVLVLRKKHIPKLHESRPILLVMFATGLFTQLATMTHQWSIRMNYLALDDMPSQGKAAVGVYSTAISLGEAILLFAASVAAVLMSRISNENQVDVSRKRTLQLSKLSLGVTIPAVLFFAVLPPSFYAWLLGEEFRSVRDSFLTIAPGIILLSFGTVYGHYFSGSGKHYMNFFSGMFGMLITFSVITVLIRHYGIFGAGITASLAYGGLAIFIFILFMLTSRNPRAEWKELLPKKEDFTALRQLVRPNNSVK